MRRSVIALLAVVGCAREKPPPADDANPASPLSPSLEILSPRAGDRWGEGTRQVIRWRTTGVAAINLGAAVGGKDKGHMLIGAPALPDSMIWAIPVGFVTGFGPDSSTEVRIRLEDATDPARFVDSDSFTIVGAARP
jgi:hypothetical protein